MTLEVTIASLAAGGDGVGKDPDGRTVFVAATAPGDRVTVELVEQHARWARGALVAITTPGPSRIASACTLFAERRCGGCDWAHVEVATQQASKHAVCVGALRRLIAAGATLAPLVSPEPAWGWRRRARLTVTADALGFHAPRSHQVADVAACPQLAPALAAALAAIREVRTSLFVAGGELHLAGDAAGVHVVSDARVDPAVAAARVGRGGIVGIAWPGGAAGQATVELEPGLWLRADEFAQAGAAGNAALIAAVLAATAVVPGERVLELYAGGGNLTRALVSAGAIVTATDAVAPRQSAAPEARFVAGPAARVMAAIVGERARFAAVVLDPPRTGAKDVVAQLAATGAARIVYVSCDPATFARDGDTLMAHGYQPRTIVPLDLMPQTAHVELVARFERVSPA